MKPFVAAGAALLLLLACGPADDEVEAGGCEDAPCINGGACSSSRRGEYVCTCPEGFTGRRCEVATSAFASIDGGVPSGGACASDNGGCDPLTACVEGDGGRSCGACPTGYSGDGEKGCVDIDECAYGNGGCDPLVLCVNTEGGRVCGACPAGYGGDPVSGCTAPAQCAATQIGLLVDAGVGSANLTPYCGTDVRICCENGTPQVPCTTVRYEFANTDAGTAFTSGDGGEGSVAVRARVAMLSAQVSVKTSMMWMRCYVRADTAVAAGASVIAGRVHQERDDAGVAFARMSVSSISDLTMTSSCALSPITWSMAAAHQAVYQRMLESTTELLTAEVCDACPCQ